MKGGVLIGLFVIISQTIVTSIVLLGFSFLFLGYYFPRELITFVLVYDVVAIALHMLYRRRERKTSKGTGIQVKKELLIFHAATSVFAIFLGFYFLTHFFEGQRFLLLTTLWFSSFISGAFVYIKKYQKI